MSEHNVENGLPANYLAPDGYRYGVMFNDGSVAARWNGKTQRRRAAEYAKNCAADFHPDNITLARWKPGDEWYTRVLPPAEETPDA